MKAEDRQIFNKLLEQGGRIDERTKNIEKDINEIKEQNGEQFKALKIHHGRLCGIENEHKDPFHRGTFLGIWAIISKMLGFVK